MALEELERVLKFGLAMGRPDIVLKCVELVLFARGGRHGTAGARSVANGGAGGADPGRGGADGDGPDAEVPGTEDR